MSQQIENIHIPDVPEFEVIHKKQEKKPQKRNTENRSKSYDDTNVSKVRTDIKTIDDLDASTTLNDIKYKKDAKKVIYRATNVVHEKKEA
jgi:hypothetical protein